MDRNSAAGTNDKDVKFPAYSTEQIVQLSGLPYTILTKYDEAIDNGAKMLIGTHHLINPELLGKSTVKKLMSWVEGGGVLVMPAIEPNGIYEEVIEKDEEGNETELLVPRKDLCELFGLIRVLNRTQSRNSFTWDTTEDFPELSYFDTKEEQTVIISHGQLPQSTAYDPSEDTDILATWDDGEAAVIRHNIGKGSVYTFGVRWTDIVYKQQFDNITTSVCQEDEFQTYADAYGLFLRACFASHSPVNIWKHTIPKGYTAAAIYPAEISSYDRPYVVNTYTKSNVSLYYLNPGWSQFPHFLPAISGTTKYTVESFSQTLNLPITLTDQGYDDSDFQDYDEDLKDYRTRKFKEARTRIKQLSDNYAPIIIAKATYQENKEKFIDYLIDDILDDDGISVSFQEYADFWRKRAEFKFSYTYDLPTRTLIIRILNDYPENFSGIALNIECDIEFEDIICIDKKNSVIPSHQKGTTVVIDESISSYIPVVKAELVNSYFADTDKRVLRGTKIALKYENPEFDSSIIYYTLKDGYYDTPDTEYKEPLIVRDDMTIKTFAKYDEDVESPMKSYLFLVKYKEGDSSGDNYIDITDVNYTVDYMIGGNPTGFQFSAADINLDSDISIYDATQTVDLVLHSDQNQSIQTMKDALCKVQSYQSCLAAYATTSDSFTIGFKESLHCIGLQFDLHLPIGVEISNVELCTPNTFTHTLAYNQNQQTVRVMIYSMQGFSLNDMNLANFTLLRECIEDDQEIKIDNVILNLRDEEDKIKRIVDAGITVILPHVQTSEINDVKTDNITLYTIGKNLYIYALKDCELLIATPLGQSQYLYIAAGRNVFNIENPGLYIVGNKKIIIK